MLYVFQLMGWTKVKRAWEGRDLCSRIRRKIGERRQQGNENDQAHLQSHIVSMMSVTTIANAIALMLLPMRNYKKTTVALPTRVPSRFPTVAHSFRDRHDPVGNLSSASGDESSVGGANVVASHPEPVSDKRPYSTSVTTQRRFTRLFGTRGVLGGSQGTPEADRNV